MVSIQSNAVRVEFGLSYQWAVDIQRSVAARIDAARRKGRQARHQARVRVRATQFAAHRTALSVKARAVSCASTVRDLLAATLLGIPANRLQDLRSLALTGVSAAAKPRTARAKKATAAAELTPCVDGLNVDAQEFRQAVGVVSAILRRSSALPILDNVLIVPGKGAITLRTFDLEAGLETTCRAEVGVCEAFTVPAKALQGRLGKHTGEMHIEPGFDAENHPIVRFEVGGSEFEMIPLPAEEFPALPTVDGAPWVPCDGLPESLKRVFYATAPDESRAILTGVLITRTDCVATDGYRMHKTPHGCDFGPEWANTDDCIATQSTTQVAKFLAVNGPGVEFRRGESKIEFRYNGVRYVSRLIEGTFPNYERIIPGDQPNAWTVPTKEFRQAVESCRTVAVENANRVILRVADGTLHISAKAGDVGKATAKVPVEVSGPGFEGIDDNPRDTIAFNQKYLLQMAKFIDSDSITIGLSGPLNAALVRDAAGVDPSLAVAMPMQIM